LTSRSIKGSVLKDPAAAAEHVLRMALDGEIVSRNGKGIKVDIHTICVHGDEATGVAVARSVRNALEKAGVAVVPLTDMKL
jgi:5-oxoprolinase (ATP-hydrolysing) subunit A